MLLRALKRGCCLVEARGQLLALLLVAVSVGVGSIQLALQSSHFLLQLGLGCLCFLLQLGLECFGLCKPLLLQLGFPSQLLLALLRPDPQAVASPLCLLQLMPASHHHTSAAGPWLEQEQCCLPIRTDSAPASGGHKKPRCTYLRQLAVCALCVLVHILDAIEQAELCTNVTDINEEGPHQGCGKCLEYEHMLDLKHT